jgi:hypothetical protein
VELLVIKGDLEAVAEMEDVLVWEVDLVTVGVLSGVIEIWDDLVTEILVVDVLEPTLEVVWVLDTIGVFDGSDEAE